VLSNVNEAVKCYSCNQSDGAKVNYILFKKYYQILLILLFKCLDPFKRNDVKQVECGIGCVVWIKIYDLFYFIWMIILNF
jgi:hypothetical protein